MLQHHAASSINHGEEVKEIVYSIKYLWYKKINNVVIYPFLCRETELKILHGNTISGMLLLTSSPHFLRSDGQTETNIQTLK